MEQLKLVKAICDWIGATAHPIMTSLIIGVLCGLVCFGAITALGKMPKEIPAVPPEIIQKGTTDDKCANWVNVGGTATCDTPTVNSIEKPKAFEEKQ